MPWIHLSYFFSDFKAFIVILIVSFFLFLIGIYKVFKSSASEKGKKFLITSFFSAFFIVLLFSFSEAYFRYVYDQSDGLGFLNTHGRWMNRHVVFNTYGYRDRDFLTEKKPGVFRIGVVGDSLTMGYGIKNVNDRFSNILEKKLDEKGFNTEVYNLGQSGLDTCSEMKEFERLKHLNFDLIVWEYFINDVQPCNEKSTGAKIVLTSFNNINPVTRFFMKESFFFDYLYWRLSPKHTTTFRSLRLADLAQFKNKPVFEQHLRDIETFSKTLQENSTSHQVVVVIFPSLFLLDDNYPARNIHKTLSATFKKQGNSVIDLLPALKNEDKNSLIVSRFDAHPNEHVHNIAAIILYGEIVPILKDMEMVKE